MQSGDFLIKKAGKDRWSVRGVGWAGSRRAVCSDTLSNQGHQVPLSGSGVTLGLPICQLSLSPAACRCSYLAHATMAKEARWSNLPQSLHFLVLNNSMGQQSYFQFSLYNGCTPSIQLEIPPGGLTKYRLQSMKSIIIGSQTTRVRIFIRAKFNIKDWPWFRCFW